MKLVMISALSLSMAMQLSAAADAPLDELNALFETQVGADTQSALAQYLAWDELCEAIAQNGIQVEGRVGLLDGTLDALYVEDSLYQIYQNMYLSFQFQENPEQTAWLLSAALGLGGESLLDASLYGDESLLALSIPQFLSGAVGISSGSFLEQYEGSGLQALLGDLGIEDFDLNFYPGASEETQSTESTFEAELLQAWETYMNSIRAEKNTEGDSTVYAVYYQTQDILDVYALVLKEYAVLLEESGILEYSYDYDYSYDDYYDDYYYDYELESEVVYDYDIEYDVDGSYASGLYGEYDYSDDYYDYDEYYYYEEDFDYSAYMDVMVDELMNEVLQMIGDEIRVDFIVENDLVTEIRYEAEFMEPVYEDYGDSEYAAESVAYVLVEVVFENPEQPMTAYDITVSVTDEFDDTVDILISKVSRENGPVSVTTVDLTVTEDGTDVYDHNLFTSEFNSSTGELYLCLKWEDTDLDEMYALTLDGTFSDVEAGQGFVFTVDELSMRVDGEVIGLTAEISVSVDAGTIEKPQSLRMLFELNEGGMTGLLTELYTNAELWLAELEGAIGMASAGTDIYIGEGETWSYSDEPIVETEEALVLETEEESETEEELETETELLFEEPVEKTETESAEEEFVEDTEAETAAEMTEGETESETASGETPEESEEESETEVSDTDSATL